MSCQNVNNGSWECPLSLSSQTNSVPFYLAIFRYPKDQIKSLPELKGTNFPFWWINLEHPKWRKLCKKPWEIISWDGISSSWQFGFGVRLVNSSISRTFWVNLNLVIILFSFLGHLPLTVANFLDYLFSLDVASPPPPVFLSSFSPSLSRIM